MIQICLTIIVFSDAILAFACDCRKLACTDKIAFVLYMVLVVNTKHQNLVSVFEFPKQGLETNALLIIIQFIDVNCQTPSFYPVVSVTGPMQLSDAGAGVVFGRKLDRP